MSQPQPPAGEIILTYDDYLHLPDDGRRYEILEGVLYVTPSPQTAHQVVLRNLGFFLLEFLRRNNLGELLYAPMDVVLSRTNVCQPDLLYISRERLHIMEERNISGAPDLVVEILSPTTASQDRVLKAQVYARYGVDFYWLVDPEARTLEEYRREGETFTLLGTLAGEEVFRPALFPGLGIPLHEVWPSL